jgi:hypothetical protein
MVESTQCLLKFVIFQASLTAIYISETAVYSPGMGLGASKGKDIGKYTDGFSSYVHMAQDSVTLFPFHLFPQQN